MSFNTDMLCRLCLSENNNYISIFDSENELNICHKINICLPIKVSRDDKLPKLICDNCMCNLDSSYNFWNMSAQSEQTLLKRLAEKSGESSYIITTPSEMKTQQGIESRLDSSVMQQMSGSQSAGMMEPMGMYVTMTPGGQQISSVPMDGSGGTLQHVQQVVGTTAQMTQGQMMQSQPHESAHQDEDDESSEEDNSDEEMCEGDEGLHMKGKSKADPSRTMQPTFVNVPGPCDIEGPSTSTQQQRVSQDMSSLILPEVDPKTGEAGETFGGLSGMLRQILSPSPETGDAVGMPSVNCNLLQSNNSVFPNQSTTTMLSSTLLTNIPPHFQSVCPEQSLLEQVQILAESYPCPTCGLEFRSVLKLNYHVRTSHAARPSEYEHNIENQPRYSCAVCSRTFVALSHLKMHEVTHAAVTSCASTSTNLVSSGGGGVGGGGGGNNMEKTFACDLCQASFRYRTLLERHRRMHEIGQEKPYSCPRCLMRFETRNLYNHHAKTHRPIPTTLGNDSGGNRVVAVGAAMSPVVVDPVVVAGNLGGGGAIMPAKSAGMTYPCDSCSKQFTTPESLTTHKAVHRSRPLVCDVCGKGFTHRKYYVVHQRIHTGERPYLCAMCGKSFTQASTLTVHRRYHTGERPYTCTLCGKGFVTRTIMLNHMKKH